MQNAAPAGRRSRKTRKGHTRYDNGSYCTLPAPLPPMAAPATAPTGPATTAPVAAPVVARVAALGPQAASARVATTTIMLVIFMGGMRSCLCCGLNARPRSLFHISPKLNRIISAAPPPLLYLGA